MMMVVGYEETTIVRGCQGWIGMGTTYKFDQVKDEEADVGTETLVSKSVKEYELNTVLQVYGPSGGFSEKFTIII